MSWLVLELTSSGTAVGMAVAAQFTPMLLGGPWGGVIADRVDKRHCLIVLQAAGAGLSVVMGLLTGSGKMNLWLVLFLGFVFGCVQAIEVPTRQSFILEMVGRDSVTNAVSLNSVLMNITRVTGPSAAGVLIATRGIAVCFYVNALSFVAVIAALAWMQTDQLEQADPVGAARGQLREGFSYVWHTPVIRTALAMMAVIGTLVFNFQTVLPVFARFTFDGDAGTFAMFMAVMGAGAVLGGLVIANREEPSFRGLTAAAIALGVLVSITALAPSTTTASLVLFFVGVAGTSFIAIGNATLQLSARPEMRGRVMALFAVAFLGSTPVGGPIVGLIAEKLGPRIALCIGGIVAIAGGIYGCIASRKFAVPPARMSADGESLSM